MSDTKEDYHSVLVNDLLTYLEDQGRVDFWLYHNNGDWGIPPVYAHNAAKRIREVRNSYFFLFDSDDAGVRDGVVYLTGWFDGVPIPDFVRILEDSYDE
jgi:hypothetical protein